MIATHKIETLTFSEGCLHLYIDGKNISLPLEKLSKKLSLASDVERNLYSISPSGYGIHWPLIDEDLSVNAIINTISAQS